MRHDAVTVPDTILQAQDVIFSYPGQTEVLSEASIRLQECETVAITGPSGSGKTTLLHCLAGILQPASGKVVFLGERLDSASERTRASQRLHHFGFVFQRGELLRELTILENIALPCRLLGKNRRAANAIAEETADTLGIGDLLGRRTWQVSGGELQRAAIARAVAHRPAVVCADEPTGALDDANAEAVGQMLTALPGLYGALLLVATHNAEMADRCQRRLTLSAGRLREDSAAGRAAL